MNKINGKLQHFETFTGSALADVDHAKMSVTDLINRPAT